MEFIERGARKLIRNEYQYVKPKDLANGLISRECIERTKGNCKAKVKLNAIDGFVEQVQEHTHAPNATRSELTRVCVSIKKKASATHDTTQQILGTELAHLTPTVNILPNPPRKEDVPLLPLEYQMTATGKIFLLFYVSVGDINRMFIIATYDGIDILGNSIQWFRDGTFKRYPQIFSRIYTIHALVSHEVLPCVFALLLSKMCMTNFSQRHAML